MSTAREGKLLVVRGLTVRFPTSDGVVQAVSDVTFSLSRGETLGVVGESGSGKSVSNLAIMGLLNRQRTVIFKHGLRASLTPIVTMFGLDIALLVGGAIITESVFNLQGLGYLAINSALQQDLPIVLGVVLLASVAVALANLIVDILYAFIDPRVRYA